MQINWVAYRFIGNDGYGRYGTHLIRALRKLGVTVRPTVSQMLYDAPRDILSLTGLDFSDISVFLLPPVVIKEAPPPRSWIYTMHEDSVLPPGWVETINQFERCLVPCEYNAVTFRESGVKVPIDVVYGGTNPDEFPVQDGARPERPYTYLTLSDRGIRKGWDAVWGAWYKAFPENLTDVKLIVKGRPEMMPPWFSPDAVPDKRIEFWLDNVGDMNEVFRQADCVVYPARGDGWGMFWREAAMTGLPAIVLDYSGNSVGVDEAAIPLKKYHLRESMLDYSKGEWAEPDQDEIAERMSWCYQNQQTARDKGRQAARWLRENQTWDHSARQLVALLEQHS